LDTPIFAPLNSTTDNFSTLISSITLNQIKISNDAAQDLDCSSFSSSTSSSSSSNSNSNSKSCSYVMNQLFGTNAVSTSYSNVTLVCDPCTKILATKLTQYLKTVPWYQIIKQSLSKELNSVAVSLPNCPAYSSTSSSYGKHHDRIHWTVMTGISMMMIIVLMTF